jgi:hypothetical protein
MNEHKASRTLVKSPPELWAECSDATSLTRHLDQFGEIKITRLEPETAVAWEGNRIRGTVRLEPSGWGTKVTLTAVAEGEVGGSAEPPSVVATEQVEPAVEREPEPPPGGPPAPAAPARRGFFARMFGRRTPEPAATPSPPVKAPSEPEPAAAAEPEPEPEAQLLSPAAELAGAEAALGAALDSLGQAHRRPFSRA